LLAIRYNSFIFQRWIQYSNGEYEYSTNSYCTPISLLECLYNQHIVFDHGTVVLSMLATQIRVCKDDTFLGTVEENERPFRQLKVEYPIQLAIDYSFLVPGFGDNKNTQYSFSRYITVSISTETERRSSQYSSSQGRRRQSSCTRLKYQIPGTTVYFCSSDLFSSFLFHSLEINVLMLMHEEELLLTTVRSDCLY
jgi:YHS domain-containing protein